LQGRALPHSDSTVHACADVVACGDASEFPAPSHKAVPRDAAQATTAQDSSLPISATARDIGRIVAAVLLGRREVQDVDFYFLAHYMSSALRCIPHFHFSCASVSCR